MLEYVVDVREVVSNCCVTACDSSLRVVHLSDIVAGVDDGAAPISGCSVCAPPELHRASPGCVRGSMRVLSYKTRRYQNGDALDFQFNQCRELFTSSLYALYALKAVTPMRSSTRWLALIQHVSSMHASIPLSQVADPNKDGVWPAVPSLANGILTVTWP